MKKAVTLQFLIVLISCTFSTSSNADSGDITDDFVSAIMLPNRTCEGYAMAVFADVDEIDNGGTYGIYETMVVFYTINGEAYGCICIGSDKQYFFTLFDSDCTGENCTLDNSCGRGRFIIRFVDMNAAGFVFGNSDTWEFKTVDEVTFDMYYDGSYDYDDPTFDSIQPYQQAKAYKVVNNPISANLIDTDHTYTGTGTDEAGWRSCHFSDLDDGIAEIYITTDFGENLIDNFIICDNGGTFVPVDEQKEPQVAINNKGRAVLSKTDYSNGAPRILCQIFNSKGFSIKDNIQVLNRTGSVIQIHSDIAVNARGHFVVVWQDDYEGNNDIYAQMFAANGEKIDAEIKVNDDLGGAEQTYPAITMNEAGQFIVCWTDERNGKDDIYAQRYDADGATLGSNFRVNRVAAYSRNYSDINMNENGEFVIVWQDARNGLVDYIYGRRFDNSGAPVGNDFKANKDLLGESRHYLPTVAMQEDGKFLVCYIIQGTTHHLYATFYENDGTTLVDWIEVPANATTSHNSEPAAAANPNGTYSVVWTSDRFGTYDIFGRTFSNAGSPIGVEIRTNLNFANDQKNPCISIDKRGVAVMAWESNASGDWKVDGYWLGFLGPLNPTAGSNFDGFVPISWDNVYSMTMATIKNFKIYRSTTSGGPYTEVAAIDLSTRGALGNQMRDWIDTDVENGTTYYYRISAIAGTLESSKSVEVSATPNAAMHELASAWSSTAPTVNGEINVNEWNNAEVIDITNPNAPLPIHLYVQNNSDWLYLAIDDANDTKIDPANTVYILYEKDNNDQWSLYEPTTDGVLYINNSQASFVGYFGAYPNGLSTSAPILNPDGVEYAISTAAGYVQYEIALKLSESDEPGATIGLAVFVEDPGTFYPYHYEYAAEWPLGCLWDSALPLGNLTLATPPTSVPAELASPENFIVSRNYPNPFNPETTISYELPAAAMIDVTVFDAQGKEVSRVLASSQPAGRHSVHWNGTNSQGHPVTSGVYFYRMIIRPIQADQKIHTTIGKMLLMK